MPRKNFMILETRGGNIALRGQTYLVRRDLKALGALWDENKKEWTISADRMTDILRIAAAAGLEVSQADSGETVPTPAPTPAPVPAPAPVPVPVPVPAAAAGTSLDDFLRDWVARHGKAAVDREMVAEMIREALAEQGGARRLEIVIGDVKRETEGLAHKSLPVLIQCLAAGLHVWLAGPSGSGKTHAAEQAAAALGLSFELQGAMTMAHELVGFVDAGGRYHETPFVRAYSEGGLILLDEIDAGSNEALLALNAALANGVMSLPTGEVVRAHADFRCIGAANTYGQGATHDYIGRTRIDAAFLQRFGAAIQWDYDESLEIAMSGNPDWTHRVIRARDNARKAGLKILVTPRASISGARLIAAGMTPDEAARLTYLRGLSEDQVSILEGK